MSPEPWSDDRVDLDPPPRGGPRLVGDMASLGACKRPVDARHSPGIVLTDRQRKMRRKHLVILLCRTQGLNLDFIADALGVSVAQISRVCKKMGYDEL